MEPNSIVGRAHWRGCFASKTPPKLPALFERLKRRHLILIDTPGSQTLERVAEIKNAFHKAQTHMVMAADASSATLNRAIRAASAAPGTA
jgi:flagellar biosynthesis GTPase FlhF